MYPVFFCVRACFRAVFFCVRRMVGFDRRGLLLQPVWAVFWVRGFFLSPGGLFLSPGGLFLFHRRSAGDKKTRARPVAVLSCVPLFGRFRIVFARYFLYSVRGRFSPWRSSSVSGLACDLDPAVFIFLSGRVFHLCPIFSCFTGAPQETKKEEPGFFVAPFVCPGVFFLAPVGCFFSCSSRKLQPRKESRLCWGGVTPPNPPSPLGPVPQGFSGDRGEGRKKR